MNSGAFKSVVGRYAFFSRYSLLVITLGLMPLQAFAATADAQFKQYLINVCTASVIPPSWDFANLSALCSSSLFAGASSPGSTVSVNLGTANAASDAASRRKKGIRVPLEEQQDKPAKGASADGAGWGFLMTPQFGSSNRRETDLENGYKSDLTGLVVGLDHRFSDRFVFGFTVGQTKDKANFFNNVGFQNSTTDTATIYGTWLPSDSVAVDGYLGYGKLNLNNQRYLAINLFTGTMNGSTNGHQTLAGLSTTYQTDIGRFNIAPFLNLDYIKTNIASYNESGSGNDPNVSFLALHYGERSVTSLTSSIGGRLSTSYGYDWGSLVPSARLAVVHEFQNRTRQISNELVLTPGTGFLVETDAPDRNYLNLGLGISAALNGGTQLFLDYDKRAQDRLLSSWAVSCGVLTEF